MESMIQSLESDVDKLSNELSIERERTMKFESEIETLHIELKKSRTTIAEQSKVSTKKRYIALKVNVCRKLILSEI